MKIVTKDNASKIIATVCPHPILEDTLHVYLEITAPPADGYGDYADVWLSEEEAETLANGLLQLLGI